MESYQIQHLTFTYANQAVPALNDLSLTIAQGQFVTICGKSGCGKSTLLRQLKSCLAPYGSLSGTIAFEGRLLQQVDTREQSQKIGFVLQSPDNQIVTDKVWHELAFGLESLGCGSSEIRSRVAEMASFFGIQTWFHQNVSELSGGQKQLLNLAAIMVMQPTVLILDEPTSQLDPIAALDFLETLAKINREFGTTIILTEHRLEDALPLSDRVLVMEQGQLIADGTPRLVGEQLKNLHHEMFIALPTPMRIYAAVANNLPCPITVREGRQWLEQMAAIQPLRAELVPEAQQPTEGQKVMVELKDVWFRYGKNLPDVVKGLSLQVYQGELYALLGGNGSGKTTSLSLLNGLLTPYRGEVRLQGQKSEEINNKYHGLLGVLPQNPQALFVKKTVDLDLREMLGGCGLAKAEQQRLMAEVIDLCELAPLLNRHPYDLSGGEQQRAALAKVLLLQPQILCLDEPTKGLDAYFKEKFAHILADLKAGGVTIIMVSHDIEFCAKYADRCGMFFDGNIVSADVPRRFFAGKSFYTTAANRMARSLIPTAVLADDVIRACGGQPLVTPPAPPHQYSHSGSAGQLGQEDGIALDGREPLPHLTTAKIIGGCCFVVLFLLTFFCFYHRWTDGRDYLVQFALIMELGLALFNFLPQKQLDATVVTVQTPQAKRHLSQRTWVAALLILLVIPLTIYVGIFFLGDRKYYFISLLIILETLLPFALVFEHRKPQARELIIISVLCAIAVAGRCAFFMLPQFKPVVALVIIAGVCLGGEVGFLVGAITGFVANMLLGQGAWTPWQMFAFGIIGFLAGVLFRKGWLRKTKGSLCIFGGLATFFIYGGIMNPAAVLMFQAQPNMEMFLTAYLMGIPFDLIHATATVVFLWFISAAMIEKIDRIKIKYGILES